MGDQNTPRDVVFSLCFLTWEDAILRGMHFPPDRLIPALLADPRVGRLLIVDTYRDRARVHAKRLLRRTIDPMDGQDPKRVTHLQPLRFGGNDDPTSREGIEKLYARWSTTVRKQVARIGMKDPVLLTGNPFVAGFSPLEWASDVTYYVWDDWPAQPNYQRWRGLLEESYDHVRERGYRMCAVTPAILDRARPSGPSLLVPNGVEPDEWARFGAPPEWFTALPGPRLLYAGTLDARLDADLVVATAKGFPDASIVLVGLLADPDHLARFGALPNVHIHPPVNRPEITAMIHASDVCLVPHVRTEQTAAMSPLKLYEYVAGGRPVAAVDLPPMRDIDARVELVDDLSTWNDAVARALAMGPASEAERLAFVEANSWERRHRDILDLALARGGASEAPGPAAAGRPAA